MTRYALIGFFLIGLIAIVYTLMSAAGGKPTNNPLEAHAQGQMEKLTFYTAGQMAPTEPFETATGGTATLADYKGQTLLVNFWATWCPPCEKEMPSLAALQSARGDRAFKVIAISVDTSEDNAYAQERLNALGSGDLEFFISPSDTGMRAAYAAGVSGFPTTIFYDAEGHELARLAGEIDWTALDAVNFVDAAIELGQ